MKFFEALPPMIVLILITPALAFLAYQEFVIVPRLRKELAALNARRAEKVRKALARSDTLTWSAPSLPAHQEFLRWVELKNDGKIRVGENWLNAFEVSRATARDARHLPRATVATNGNGEALIDSHGKTFIARFQSGQWDVQPTNDISLHET